MTAPFFKWQHVTCWFLVSSIAWLMSSHLYAADSDAKLLFNEGIANYNNKEYEIAADLFQRAYDAKPSWKLLFNIGQAQAAAKKYGLALQAFEGYLVDGGDNVTEERQQTTLAEIERLRLLVGLLEVTAPPGLEVVVNGSKRGETPLSAPIRVAVGNHTVEFVKDGEIVWETKAAIGSGVTTKLLFEKDDSSKLSANDASTENEPTSSQPQNENGKTSTDKSESNEGNDISAKKVDSSSDSNSRVDEKRKISPKMLTGIIVGGVGVVGLGVGTAFTVAAGKSYAAAQDSQFSDQVAFESNYNDYEKRRTVAVVSLIAGGVLAAVSGTLIVLDVIQSKKKKQSAFITPMGLSLHF